MDYRVHKFHVDKEIDDIALERFLNDLKGEVVSVIPNVIPKFHMMGATAGYNYLLVIEKLK